MHVPKWRSGLALAAVAAGLLSLLGTGMASAAPKPTTNQATPPPIKHVWLINLENEGLNQTLGKPGYLGTTLPSLGVSLTSYYAVGHDSADNYIAQISGQAPDPATDNDCGVWTPFPSTAFKLKPFNQLVGNGCVFPPSVPTLGNQLSNAGVSWKAYLQDMGNDPARDHTVQTAQGPACGHPVVGQPDPTEGGTPGDQYASRHQGFMYFESIINNENFCKQHILSFQPLLSDLSANATTPAFNYLTPNLCNDGHDSPCANGDPGGTTEISAFLSIWIPIIMASPAYKDNGLIIVTFDEGSTAAACCGETIGRTPSHPNTALPGMFGPGGGKVETVLISPFIKAGTTSNQPYNHYSLLRSIEDIFGVSHLGDANQPQVHSFGSDVYNNV